MAFSRIDTGELIVLAYDFGKVAAVSTSLTRVAVRKTAVDIKSSARSFAAVDSGNMKDQIHTRATGELSSEVTADAEYSYWVENGTSTMAAQPFMRPAADKHEPAFEKAMEQILGRALGG